MNHWPKKVPMSFRHRMDFLSTYFQWFLVSLAARETRIAWREAYPDFNSLLSTSLIFCLCFVSACFLFPRYSIDVYDFLVSKRHVYIVLVGPWISQVGFQRVMFLSAVIGRFVCPRDQLFWYWLSCVGCLFGEMLGQLDLPCLLTLFKSCAFRVLYVSYFCFCLVGFAILSVCFPMVERTHDLYVS
jgi:hypothetical protein